MFYNSVIVSISRVYMDIAKKWVSVNPMMSRFSSVIALVMLFIPASGLAHEVPKTGETEELLLEESSTSEQTEQESSESIIIYYRVGGRLDRVTVERPSGLPEVYQNNNSRNNLWNADESELGDLQNIRQWRLGSW